MPAFIPDEFIQRLLDETDIVSLVDSHIPLNKKGKDHWALCPFCDDGNKPSFSVSQQKQFYYCFRCRASGNAIGFLMNYQSHDFQGAIEILANNAGLEIPKTGNDKNYEKNKKIFEVNALATDFYVNNLYKDGSQSEVKNYLLNRGINEETIKTFQIGFAPKGWDNLSTFFKKNLDPELQKVDAGLFKISEKNNKIYDVFRNRIIFPIKSHRDQIIGFGGRVIDPADNPKYLNSSDSDIFKKGRELYGLSEILKNKKRINRIVVVEGYTDVLSLFSNDMNYAVATLGIATSKVHIDKLFTHVDEVIFCFDGDDAGVKAAESALNISLSGLRDGKKIKFMFLPEGEDPSSLLEKEGKEEFEKRMENSKVLSEYLFENILKKYDDSIESKASAMKEFLDITQLMPSSNFKKIMFQEFSKKLGVELEEIKQPERQKEPDARMKKNQVKEEKLELDKVSKSIIKVLIDSPNLSSLPALDIFLEQDSFMSKFLNFMRSKENLTFPMILQAFEGKKQFLIDLAEDENLIAPNESKEYLIQAVNFLMKNDKENLLSQLKEKYENDSLSDHEKIELKKLLMNKFDDLDARELVLLKNI
ncbi:MAG: DNA primase [Pseudomonadota bacterium]|nr:DNA primase [Pseudomonadota bacterium]